MIAIILRSFLPKRKILSIDLGSYESKVVKGKNTKNGIIVDKYFSIPTPEGAYRDGEILDKDLLSYVIKEKLKEERVKNKNVYFTINSSSIITREIIIPKVEDNEIEGVVRFQVGEYLPMDVKNYIIQFKTLGSIYEDNVEKLNILLVAIPKDIVDKHFQLAQDLDLEAKVLDYQSNSIAKLLNYNSQINQSYPTEEYTFAAIDLGYDSSKVTIINKDLIRVSRIVDIGTRYMNQNILNFFELNPKELEEKKLEIENINKIEEDTENNRYYSLVKDSIKNLNERIEMIFRYYLTRNTDNKIDLILLYGGGAGLGGISNLFTNHFNIPTIRVEDLDQVGFGGEIHKYMNALGGLIRNTEV